MWHIRQDILWCEANHRIALMDLSTQRYFTLSVEAEGAFRRLIHGEPPAPHDEARIAPLLAAVPVGETPPLGLTTPVDAPTSSAIENPSGHAGIIPIGSAMVCRLSTEHLLRHSPFKAVIADLKALKAKVELQTRPASLRHRNDAVAAFLATSQLIKTQNLCLAHSIAMFRFLAARNYLPQLVLGVKMTPWAAHAWVQDENTVLNDTVDRVRPFTPILVI